MEYNNYECPNCGCNKFVSEPNAWDVMEFTNENKFDIVKQDSSDYTEHIFCQECYAEVDENKSITKQKIILKEVKGE